MIDFTIEEGITNSKSSGPDLTPMIDMVFILLVFFLLTSVFVLPGIDVDLPNAKTGEKTEKTQLTVSIERSGMLFVNDQRVTKHGLEAYLKDFTTENRIEDAFIRADETLEFRDIIDVMDTLRSVGFTEISFIVEQE